MTELIDGILKKTGGKDRSIRWFREKVKELGEVPPQTLVREGLVTACLLYTSDAADDS